jgi:hypothetical protein
VTTGLWANVYATTFRGALVGNVTGNVSGSAGSVAYSNLTGTVPTWNQNTTGTASNLSGIPNISVGTIGCGAITSTGAVSATDFTATSDRRLKKDIETISNALRIVEELRGVYFTRIGLTYRSVGVIAQEVEDILPEVVYTSTDDIKSVSYGNIVAILIEAIKGLSKRIQLLESKWA